MNLIGKAVKKKTIEEVINQYMHYSFKTLKIFQIKLKK